jgi:hypothetical protein
MKLVKQKKDQKKKTKQKNEAVWRSLLATLPFSVYWP